MVLEILVHVRAHSKFEDDQKYRDIASQVEQFCPSTRVHISTNNGICKEYNTFSFPSFESIQDDTSQLATLDGRTQYPQPGTKCNDEKRPDRKRSFGTTSYLDQNEMAQLDIDTVFKMLETLQSPVRAPTSKHWRNANTTKLILEIGHEQLKSHVSQPYGLLRGIRPFERGFWNLDLAITCYQRTASRRQANIGTNESAVSSGDSRNLWTVEDFINFWRYASEKIQNGDMGPVSIYRTNLSMSSTDDTIHLDLRLYCWGYAVTRLHMMMRQVSEHLIDGSTYCWIGSDGEVALWCYSKDDCGQRSEVGQSIRDSERLYKKMRTRAD